MKSQPLTFYIDCPTSKAKVVLAAIQQVATKLEKMKHKKYCVYIPCGARLDLLHGVKKNCEVHFGADENVFVCTQHAGGNQTRRSVPTYAVVLVSAAHPLKHVPAHTETNKCRANVWESLRLRCVDANCPHMTKGATACGAAQPPAAGAAPAADAEFFQDDGEDEAVGETLAIEEDNGGTQDDAELELIDTDALKKMKTEAKDIFCLAKPLDYYRKTLTTILGMSTGRLVVITRTAHPGLPVAARALGLEVLVCVEDCPPHSKGHGDDLMIKFWKQLKWKEAEAASVPKEVRSVGSSELTFIMALAPEKAVQIVQACSPPPDFFVRPATLRYTR